MNKLLLGRYVPIDSVIHRLDPRTKLLIALIFIVLTFLANNGVGYALLVAFLFLVVFLSKINLGFFLNGMKTMVFIIFLTVVFQIFFTHGGPVYFQWGPLSITQLGLINGLFIFIRLTLIITMSTLLTLTTAPLELTDGLEQLMRPLARFGFPTHEVALMLSIALRYVPTLMDEAQKIMNAQRARGVEFNQGSFMERLKSIVPILVPLFVSAFNRAEEMANAMEARGYQGGEGRSKYRQLSFSKLDRLAWAFSVILILGIAFSRFFLPSL